MKAGLGCKVKLYFFTYKKLSVPSRQYCSDIKLIKSKHAGFPLSFSILHQVEHWEHTTVGMTNTDRWLPVPSVVAFLFDTNPLYTHITTVGVLVHTTVTFVPNHDKYQACDVYVTLSCGCTINALLQTDFRCSSCSRILAIECAANNRYSFATAFSYLLANF